MNKWQTFLCQKCKGQVKTLASSVSTQLFKTVSLNETAVWHFMVGLQEDIMAKDDCFKKIILKW